MIITKIRDWVPTNGLIHTSTIWELALDENFETIIYTKEDDINLSFFQYDIDVPIDIIYYLRQRKIMNNGEQEIVSQTIEIRGTETTRENVILPRDMFIAHPTVYVDEAAIEKDDEIKVTTSEFKANDGYHAYTHWIVLDALGKVLYCSLYDKENLTSIMIPNASQNLAMKTKLTFRAIHGTNLGIESKAGNHVVINNTTNFEITTNLNNVFAYQDLTVKFKKISNNIRLGIYSIDVYYGSNLSTSKRFYVDENTNSITINWWMLKHGSELSMHIKCVDLYDNVVTIKKRISVATLENEIIKDSDYRYSKILSGWTNCDSTSQGDFFIPNGFYSEPLHNNYIPMVKKGTDKLHYYKLNDDGALEYVGDFNGITLPTDDELKEGMHIRRLNQDVVLISRLNTGKKHQIDFYKYNIEDDAYMLFKELEIPDEQKALGWTNAIVQIAKSRLLYIPVCFNTENSKDVAKLKAIDTDSYVVETISEDIPYIIPEEYDIISGTYKDGNIKSPTMVYLGDGRVLIAGGYSSTCVTYDYRNESFQQSISWEYESYIGNQLQTAFLNNGDSLVFLTEKEDRGISTSQDNISSTSTTKVSTDLETLFATVNKNTKMYNTVVRFDQTKYIVKLNTDFQIDFVTNFGSFDTDQMVVIYDKDAFRLDEKTVLGLTFRALSKAATGTYTIKVIMSKNQKFNQTTYQPTVDFTHTVVVQDITVEVIAETLIEQEDYVDETGQLGQNTSNSVKELVVLLGNSYNYGAGEVELKCYKEDEINIPFETINCVYDDLEFDKTELLAGQGDIKFSKINTNMGMITIKNYILTTNLNIGIYNRLRRSKFIDVVVSFVDTPATGLPNKPAILDSNGKELGNMAVLSYTELTRYNFTMENSTAKPSFIVNRSDLGSVVTLTTAYNYMFSVKGKGFTYLYITSEKFPNEIYSNRFYLINNVDLIPKLDIANSDNSIDLVYSSSRTATFTNDLTGYLNAGADRGYEIFIEQEQGSRELVTVEVKGFTLVLTTTNRTGYGTFKVGIRNKTDGISKISTFGFTVYLNEVFPASMTCKFLDSTTGLNNETLWFNPGTTNPYTYTKTGNAVAIEIPEDSFFEKEQSEATLTSVAPQLILKGDTDLGSSSIRFIFKNTTGANASILTKNIRMVPAVFYIDDRFDGLVLVNDFGFTTLNGEYTEYKVKAQVQEGYSVTSIKLVPIEDTDTTGLKYSIRESSDVDAVNTYTLKFEPPASQIEKVYKFRIQYTYTNSNGNLTANFTDTDYQTITVTSVYYKKEAYLHIQENNFTMKVGETKKINLLTNGEKIKYTLSQTDLLELDEINQTITALRSGRASIIIAVGSEQQVPEQDTLYVDIEDKDAEPDKPEGYCIVTPSPVKLYVGLRMNLNIDTNADGYSITSDNKSIATYDNITKELIGVSVGETKLKIRYYGENIKGGVLEVDVAILETPTGDPSVLYFDSFNHTLTKTDIQFGETYPKSVLRDHSGKTILAVCKPKNEKNDLSGYLTWYTIFY